MPLRSSAADSFPDTNSDDMKIVFFSSWLAIDAFTIYARRLPIARMAPWPRILLCLFIIDKLHSLCARNDNRREEKRK